MFFLFKIDKNIKEGDEKGGGGGGMTFLKINLLALFLCRNICCMESFKGSTSDFNKKSY